MLDAVATIVIVNYEGRGRLGACLDGVAALEGPPHDVVVVDNASSDGSWDEAAGRDGVTLLRNARNVGFGAACNQGAALARGAFVAFLNYDSVPDPAWLHELVAVAAEHPDAGAIQGVVLRPDGGVNSAGNRMHYLGFGWAPQLDRAPTGEAFETFCGSGASLLVPRERFAAVGGFWEAMFLYQEDADLCWRLRLRGWRILVCPGARSLHDYDFDRNPRKLYHLERNRLLMLGANYEAGTLLRLAPALAATELGLAAIAARQGWLREKLEATGSALANLPRIARQRRDVQRSRTVGDRELAPLLERRLGPEFGDAAARLTAPALRAYARLAGLRA